MSSHVIGFETHCMPDLVGVPCAHWHGGYCYYNLGVYMKDDTIMGISTYRSCHSPLCQITPRQKVLLELMASNPGATNYDLACQLKVSERTVKRYLSEIYRAVGVQNRSECLTMLVRQSLGGGQRHNC
jgi:DNA-binding NarL/FixJ family response regulator